MNLATFTYLHLQPQRVRITGFASSARKQLANGNNLQLVCCDSRTNDWLLKLRAGRPTHTPMLLQGILEQMHNTIDRTAKRNHNTVVFTIRYIMLTCSTSLYHAVDWISGDLSQTV